MSSTESLCQRLISHTHIFPDILTQDVFLASEWSSRLEEEEEPERDVVEVPNWSGTGLEWESWPHCQGPNLTIQPGANPGMLKLLKYG